MRRKRWEEIAETLIGAAGTVKHAGRTVKCTVKEVVIENVSGKPELTIVTEDAKRHPLKRFTISTQTKSKADAESRDYNLHKQLKETQYVEKLIKAGKATLVNRNDSGHCVYEVRTVPSQSPKIVIFSERHQRVIKVL